MQTTPENKEGAPAALKNMAHDALHDLLHFDTKLFRTLPALVFRPGKVTEGSLEPGQQRYVKPFTLFVFLNFVFFVFKSKGLFRYTLDAYRNTFEDLIIAKAAELHISMNILAERFNMAMRLEEREYFVVMVPFFALVLQMLYWLRRRGFGIHLVFALNFYAFLIVFLIIIPYLLIPVAWLWDKLHTGISLFNSETSLITLVFLCCFIYLSMAVRRIYREKIWLVFVKSAALSVTVLLLITMVYRTLMFFIVMNTVSE